MSAWRREAADRLPEFQKLIASPEIHGPTMLWIELNLKFEHLCKEEPVPVDTLRKIWNYGKWCLKHPSNDVSTACAVGFCEHLLDTPARAMILPKIMSREDFVGCRDLILYHQSEADFERWLKKLWP